MAKPSALSGPEQARQTLVHRMTPLADRLRGKLTKFGLRSQRVFLVWTHWTGSRRGEGEEQTLAEVELLPTPRVSEFTGISLRGVSIGVYPEGSIRVDQISAGAYTYDILRGVRIPRPSTEAPRADKGASVNQHPIEPAIDETTSFFYELREDGRGDDPPVRRRFRVFGTPARKEGSLYYAVILESADEERGRLGQSQVGVEEGLLPDA